MNRKPLRPIADEEIETFWRDGVVCLRNVVDHDWLESLVDSIEALLRDSATVDLSSIAESLRPAVGAADRILEDKVAAGQAKGRYAVHSSSNIAAIRHFETGSMLPEIAGSILRSAWLDLFVDQILVKEPGSSTRTAFHVDEPYFNVVGDKVCTVWTPLDSVTLESGAMGYVRGSHRWADRYLPNYFVSQATLAEAGDTGRVRLPDIEGRPDAFDIVYFDTEPGDVIVHHYRTAHGSGGNTTRDRRRRAVAVRYCGDDVRWEPSDVAPTEGIPMFDNSLRPGDPLSAAGDLFPRCWTVPAAVPPVGRI